MDTEEAKNKKFEDFCIDDLLKIAKNGSKIISEKFWQAMEFAAKEFFENISKEQSRILLILSKKGWYIDMNNMPSRFFNQFIGVSETEIIDKAESSYIEYFRENASSIIQNLSTEYPDRRQIFCKAMDAHNRGDYELSVPIFLIQANGIISQELGGYELYGKGRKTGIARYINSLDEKEKQSVFLRLFLEPILISANKKEREKYVLFNELNRHQILHGEKSDYANEINSLKAISWLNYTVTVLVESKKK